MKLATAADVLARMNLSAAAGGSDLSSIEAALDGSTELVESIIGTQLGRASVVDYYSIAASDVRTPYAPLTLWTSRCFIHGAVHLYLSEIGDAIFDCTGMTPAVAGPGYVLADAEKGEVVLHTQPYVGIRTVAVSYTAGFSGSVNGTNAQPVPPWLRAAAINGAIYLRHSQAVQHGKKDVVSALPGLKNLVRVACQERIFSRYGGIYPCFSEVTQ